MDSTNINPRVLIIEDDDWAEDDEPCPDHCGDKVPLGGYYHCHVCDREWLDVDDEQDDLFKTPTETKP